MNNQYQYGNTITMLLILQRQNSQLLLILLILILKTYGKERCWYYWDFKPWWHV